MLPDCKEPANTAVMKREIVLKTGAIFSVDDMDEFIICIESISTFEIKVILLRDAAAGQLLYDPITKNLVGTCKN